MQLASSRQFSSPPSADPWLPPRPGQVAAQGEASEEGTLGRSTTSTAATWTSRRLFQGVAPLGTPGLDFGGT
eukprot:4248473-Pyramimonas_sp.AAC.1